jgi:UDP-N-acetylglucosamine acyltransferase
MNLGTEQGGGVTRMGDDCSSWRAATSPMTRRWQPGDRGELGRRGGALRDRGRRDHRRARGIHQWVRIGRGAIIGAVTMVTNDVIPYGLVQAPRGELDGLNLVGLKRRGVSRADITALRAAYQMLAQGEGTFVERARRLGDETRVLTCARSWASSSGRPTGRS